MPKLYKKIDIYVRATSQWPDAKREFYYVCSTNQSRTCKEAVARFCQAHGYNPASGFVRARFA